MPHNIREVVFEAEDVTGMAVHIGARVAALANPGEVVVSQTVRVMVIGSLFEFTTRGRHELKGSRDLGDLPGNGLSQAPVSGQLRPAGKDADR